jgi:hypothetical protein
MDAPEQNGVTPQDLLLIVGELVVENRLLRARLALIEATAETEDADDGE